MNPINNMDYLLLLICGFLFVAPSFQRDDRLTALKDATIARLALRGGNRGRLRLSGEYSGILGEAAAKVKADRATGLGGSARRLDVEGAVRGILGGAAEGHIYSDGKEGIRPFGGIGVRRNLDAGFSASRPFGAAVGGRTKLTAGVDAGLGGIATEVRGGVEGGFRGPLGAGASGGFDGGFHGGVGLPVVTGPHVYNSRRSIQPAYRQPGFAPPSYGRPPARRGGRRVVRTSRPAIYSGYQGYY